MAARIPGAIPLKSMIYLGGGHIAEGFVIERTPSVFRIHHNLVPLFWTDRLEDLSWAYTVPQGEFSTKLTAADISARIESAVSEWLETEGRDPRTALDKLMDRQRALFSAFNEAPPNPSPAGFLGPPNLRSSYAMTLIVSGNAPGSRVEMVRSLALFLYHLDIPSNTLCASSLLQDAIALAKTWGIGWKQRAFEHSLRSFEQVQCCAAEFDSDFHRLREQLQIKAVDRLKELRES